MTVELLPRVLSGVAFGFFLLASGACGQGAEGGKADGMKILQFQTGMCAGFAEDPRGVDAAGIRGVVAVQNPRIYLAPKVTQTLTREGDRAILSVLIETPPCSAAEVLEHVRTLNPAPANAKASPRWSHHLMRISKLGIEWQCKGETLKTYQMAGDAEVVYTGATGYRRQMSYVKKGDEDPIWIALLQNDYQADVTYSSQVPVFRSMELNLARENVSTATVNAFKTAVQTWKKKGGSFLFIDWSKQSAKNTVKQNVRSTATQDRQTDIDILARDLDPADQTRLDQILGHFTLTETNFVTGHQGAALQAQVAGDKEMARLHTQYLEAVKRKDEGKQKEILGAVTALKDSSILGFLSGGGVAGFGSTSDQSAYEFRGFQASRIRTTEALNFRQLMMKSVEQAFLVQLR